MKRFIEKQYLIKRHLVALIAFSLSFYFAYHLMQGNRSYPRLIGTYNQVETLQSQLEQLKKRRFELHQKVALLRPGSVDEDMLMERARLMLGTRYEGEWDYILK